MSKEIFDFPMVKIKYKISLWNPM